MLVTIIFCMLLVLAFVGQIFKKQADAAEGVVAEFSGLRLTPTELIEGYGSAARRHAVADLHAAVEDSGTLNRRVTASRLLVLGPFALAAPKKQDDRCVYLTVVGPQTAILRTVKLERAARAGTKARKFAITLNMYAIRIATASVESIDQESHRLVLPVPRTRAKPELPTSAKPVTCQDIVPNVQPTRGRDHARHRRE